MDTNKQLVLNVSQASIEVRLPISTDKEAEPDQVRVDRRLERYQLSR